MTEQRGDIIETTGARDYDAADQPAWLRERLDGFMDRRFGLIIHWGPYSQWDGLESWGLVPEDAWARTEAMRCWTERDRDLARFAADYRRLNETFHPAAFDPDGWAALAAEAGCRYLAFTTKHHDGFCLFDTRTTDYRITHPSCPFHADPRANAAREVFDAARRHGLAVTCYFSKSDWHSPFYWSPDAPVVDRNPNYDTHADPERWARFVAFAHEQVRELMSGYGPIDCLWLDGGQVRPPDQDLRMDDLVRMARALQPGLLVADRTVGGPHENFITPEQQVPDAPLGVPWESCVTLGDQWKYVEGDVFKPAGEVIRLLCDVAAKGGNLLLGVGPDPLGRMPDGVVDRMREIGAWMRVNGEAIYGTRPVPPYAAGGVRFTAKDGAVYAIVFAADGNGGTLPARLHVPAPPPAPGATVTLLGDEHPVAWTAEADGFRADLSGRTAPCAHAWTLRITP